MAEPRKGREGSRWWNERPDSEDVAKWFADVPLHEGMDPDRYIGGIVLIEQTVKTKEIDGYHESGAPIIREDVKHLTYTPYPKVETRVQYFHDLMAQHPDWMGVIEPVGGADGLPPGFSLRTVPYVHNGKTLNANFVCCTQQVRVFDRETVTERTQQLGHYGEIEVVRTGLTVINPPPATKMVSLLDRWGKADPFSIMKAETGAVGRALGMAGMLVVPGAGVATAEDMAEATALDGSSPAPSPEQAAEAAQVPQDGASQENQEEALRERITAVLASLKEADPGRFERFQAWGKEKGYGPLSDTNLLQLKGIAKKAEKELDAAGSPPSGDDPPEPDASSE